MLFRLSFFASRSQERAPWGLLEGFGYRGFTDVLFFVALLGAEA